MYSQVLQKSKPQVCFFLKTFLVKYDRLVITVLNGAKNRAILPSFAAVTSTSGDIATPPVHFLWKTFNTN